MSQRRRTRVRVRKARSDRKMKTRLPKMSWPQIPLGSAAQVANKVVMVPLGSESPLTSTNLLTDNDAEGDKTYEPDSSQAVSIDGPVTGPFSGSGWSIM